MPSSAGRSNSNNSSEYSDPATTAGSSAFPDVEAGFRSAAAQENGERGGGGLGSRGRVGALGGRMDQLTSPSDSPASYHFNIGTVETFEHKLEMAQREMGIASKDFIPVVYVTETNYANIAMSLLPTLLISGIILYSMRGSGMGGGSGGPGGIFKIGKSKAKLINKENVTTTFADVAGCDEAKREIMEFVQFLKDSKKFTDLGAKIPKGALLCGPPGECSATRLFCS
jgi:ATP-dependent Zn protease